MSGFRPWLYAAAHFLVDFCCALLALGRICPEWDPATALLLYNFLAFAVQMPIGLRAGPLGIFVSPGALGVYLGGILAASFPYGTGLPLPGRLVPGAGAAAACSG